MRVPSSTVLRPGLTGRVSTFLEKRIVYSIAHELGHVCMRNPPHKKTIYHFLGIRQTNTPHTAAPRSSRDLGGPPHSHPHPPLQKAPPSHMEMSRARRACPPRPRSTLPCLGRGGRKRKRRRWSRSRRCLRRRARPATCLATPRQSRPGARAGPGA